LVPSQKTLRRSYCLKLDTGLRAIKQKTSALPNCLTLFIQCWKGFCKCCSLRKITQWFCE